MKIGNFSRREPKWNEKFTIEVEPNVALEARRSALNGPSIAADQAVLEGIHVAWRPAPALIPPLPGMPAIVTPNRYRIFIHSIREIFVCSLRKTFGHLSDSYKIILWNTILAKNVRLASVALAAGFCSNPRNHLINSLAIANLGSHGLASPIRCEGDDAGPIMRVLITRMELLENFLGNIIRFQQ
jgi:hypothetical protein